MKKLLFISALQTAVLLSGCWQDSENMICANTDRSSPYYGDEIRKQAIVTDHPWRADYSFQ